MGLLIKILYIIPEKVGCFGLQAGFRPRRAGPEGAEPDEINHTPPKEPKLKPCH